MNLRSLSSIAFIAVLSTFATAPAAQATERFVFEKFPPPGSEEEETGDLFALEEGGEPQPLEIWGQNPSLDTRGRLVAFYENHAIYVTDYRGKHTKEVLSLPESSDAAAPQWVPGGGFVTDGTGNILMEELGSQVWTVTPVIGWSGRQWAPAVSPDGSKIAFLSETNPKGEDLPGYGPAIFVANIDGTEPVQVTSPEVISLVSAPSFSPDGQRVVVAAYWEFDEWESADLASISLESKEITPITNILIGSEEEPDWLPDGRIAFTEEYEETGNIDFLTVEEGSFSVSPLMSPYTHGEFAAHFSGRQPVDWPPLTAESQSRATRLLLQYAPTLKYDSTETYRALGVESITNLYGGSEPGESNRLVEEEGEAIAYSNPKLSEPHLSLSLLVPKGKNYPGSKVSVAKSDRLVERGSYAEDAAVLQEEPSIGDRIYERAFYAEGQWWLQYWFWYYYDDFGLLEFGNHEGDWEMIQIGLGEYGNPQAATYAQHHDSEADSCNFDFLNWTVGEYANVSPVVYVATGTHASYVRPGLSLGSFPYDRADGEGYEARPIVEMMPVGEWAGWPGRWGNSMGEAKSPMAPISQERKWDTPGAFSEEAESCPVEEEGTVQARLNTAGWRPPTLPPAPVIDAKYRSEAVMFDYQLQGHRAKGREGLEVAVLAHSKSVTPTKRILWSHSGHKDLALPAGIGPYTVVARSVLRTGAASRDIRRLVGPSITSDRGDRLR